MEFIDSHASETAILLIDSSGSVRSVNKEGLTIFQKMEAICKTLLEKKFRVLFWNSDNSGNVKFKNGTYSFPFVIDREKLGQPFSHVRDKIDDNCLTYPHLAFENIDEKWIDNKEPTVIYFVTDGQIGYGGCGYEQMNRLKDSLTKAIKLLFDKYNNIHLNIISVENVKRDFSQVESLDGAAGCDVYRLIMSNKLTKYVSKFKSYTENYESGFTQIEKTVAPAGFIPYEKKYFSVLKINQFVNYISKIIKETDSEEDLLKIIQNLSVTLSVMLKDNPEKIRKDKIKTFCSLFENSKIDVVFAEFILTEAVESENAGMANMFTEYREKLKNLYKEAQKLLFKNVKDATGINNCFISLPLHNKIILGNYRFIDKSIRIKKDSYHQAGILLNNVLVPIFPLRDHVTSQMHDQCLRQWIRAIVGHQYHVDSLGDIIIHIILGLNLKIQLLDLPEKIKKCYRHFGETMLRKKRLSTNVTELEKLEEGNLFLPNSGKIEEFNSYMNRLKDIFNFKFEPLTIWYAMCLALGNEKIISKQYIHCAESIEKDFPQFKKGTDSNSKLFELIQERWLDENKDNTIKYFEIPFELTLDYSCIVTLEDTSLTGGYKILPHENITGNMCSPIYVFSEEGYLKMTEEKGTLCPVCYVELKRENFEKIGKKPEIKLETIFPEGCKSIFSDNIATGKVVDEKKIQSMEKTGTVIILRGTVGAGKSTAAQMIKQKVEEKGGYCLVVGTDKFCKEGIPTKQAIELVSEEIRNINNIKNKNIVLVVDTCGEKTNIKNVFGHDLKSWNLLNLTPNLPNKKQEEMKKYFAWSLRNVLLRKKPTTSDNFYLNAESASYETCMKVHKDKALKLFGKKIYESFNVNGSSKELVIENLTPIALEYEKKLKEGNVLENQIDDIIKNLKLD